MAAPKIFVSQAASHLGKGRAGHSAKSSDKPVLTSCVSSPTRTGSSENKHGLCWETPLTLSAVRCLFA